MSEIGLSLLFALLVLFSGFLTLVEFSLLRLKRTKIRELVEAESLEDWLQFWLKRSEKFRLTSLVLGTMARIGAGILLFVLLRRMFTMHEWLSSAITLVTGSIFIIMLGELLPRALGRAYGDRFARYLFYPMWGISIITYAFTYPFLAMIRLLGRIFGVRESLNPVADFEEDIMDILDVRESSTELEDDEKELISSVVEFAETIVREVMIPRVDMVAINKTATLADIHRKILDTGHSRIPVYDETIDNITGVFYVKDLLKYFGEGNLEKYPVPDDLHEPMFVPETKNINDLLKEFQQKKVSIAIVVDEYGGTAGIVTVKDLLEEIVGEIQDQDDLEEVLYTVLPDGSFSVDAKMSVDEIKDELDISIPESSEYDTIGGYIYTVLGKVPHKDEVFQRDGIIIRVLDVDERRIHKVLLKKAGEGSQS